MSGPEATTWYSDMPNAWGCYDPQCGDSTWDHECPVIPPGVRRADSDPAYCGYCDHHADRHDYPAGPVDEHHSVPCRDCPNGICDRKDQESL